MVVSLLRAQIATVRSTFVFSLLWLCPGLIAAQPIATVRVDFTERDITAQYSAGLAQLETDRAVHPDDPVRIASVSKLVLAIGLMRLVDEGRLDLHRDVSEYLGWTLRHPGFPEQPITLTLLLSHRSGLTDEAGYIADTSTRLREQVLNPKAWDMRHGPGEFFRYTNLNFPVIAAVMERVTGERFDLLMQRLLFKPLAIDACYNWASCSDQAIARAVTIYRADGSVGIDDLRGQRPACPVLAASDGSCRLEDWQPGENGGMFSPQGGLRISIADLAKIGQLLLNDGVWQAQRLLRASSVQRIFEPLWIFDGSNGLTYESDIGDPGGALFCRYGLASQTLATRDARCADDVFGDAVPRVGHGGDAYGLVSGLWLDRANKRGVAYFISGGDLTEKGRISAFYAVEERLLGVSHPAESARAGCAAQ